MITLLVPPGRRAVGDRLELGEDEVHHLRVRRGESGVTVGFRDGEGGGGTGLLEVDGRRHVLLVERVESIPAPAPLVLAVGAGDRERFTWLVEKAAELGVTDIAPIETERTPHVAGRLRASHVEKLSRRGREAIKQSGAYWAPRVLPPASLASFLNVPRAGARWLLDGAGDEPGTLACAEAVTALIGPEGGFTESERARVVDAGFQPVRVGPHVLRFETAAIAAATIVHLVREREAHG